MQHIKTLIEKYSHDMLNPIHNFEIAQEYERIGHTSPAVSFYLRAAEYGYEYNPSIVYESLIRISFCVEDQKEREHTVSNCLLQAIEYEPLRPEAYLLMSRHYEKLQKWQESYAFAVMGLANDWSLDTLSDLGYPGVFALKFQKALAGYHIGRKDESQRIFNEISSEDLPEEYRIATQNNLAFINQEK